MAYFSSEIFWITDLEYFSFVVMEHPMWNFRNVRTPTDFQSDLLTYQKFCLIDVNQSFGSDLYKHFQPNYRFFDKIHLNLFLFMTVTRVTNSLITRCVCPKKVKL